MQTSQNVASVALQAMSYNWDPKLLTAQILRPQVLPQHAVGGRKGGWVMVWGRYVCVYGRVSTNER